MEYFLAPIEASILFLLMHLSCTECGKKILLKAGKWIAKKAQAICFKKKKITFTVTK